MEHRTLYHRYEKAGVVIHDQPVPWNAESVVVEASLSLPSASSRSLQDYRLDVTGLAEPIKPERLQRPNDANHVYHLTFRLPPFRTPINATLHWRDRQLGQCAIPILSKGDFLQSLRMQLSSLYVRLGDEQVSCKKFVANQCRGLLASSVLNCPTALIPMVDLPLLVEFHNERDDEIETVPVRLSASQLANRQAMLTALPQRYPRKLGKWTVNWRIGDHPLDTLEIQGVSQRELERSLRVSTTRFVVQNTEGELRVSRTIPNDQDWERLGPCFLMHSRESGLAGQCRLNIRAIGSDDEQGFEQNALISDALTMIVPGTIDAAAVEHLQAFELRLKKNILATLPVGNAPQAEMNSEGAVNGVPEYEWSLAADEELNERLNALLEN